MPADHSADPHAPTSAPLHGITVVEYCDYEGVAYCGRLLAALGAQVFKLEPCVGDPVRSRPPLTTGAGESPSSIAFEYLNAGKHGVDVDLPSADGLVAAQELCSSADVVLTTTASYRELGLDEVPRPPRQIRLRAGVAGVPFEDGVTSAFTRFHATATAYLVPSDKDSSQRPAWSGPYAFESVHGTCMAVTVLAELRSATGAELDYSYAAYSLWLEKMFVGRITTRQLETLHRYTLAYPWGGNVTCKDGHVCLFAIEEHHWRGLCRVLGRPDWLDEPRYADGVLRVGHQDEIQRALEEWCAVHSVQEVISAARTWDVPAGVVRQLDQVPQLDALVERDFMQKDAKGALTPGFPFGPGLRAEPLRSYERISPSVRWCLTEPASTASSAADRADSTARAPLSGVRVLDFTWAAAGPAITSMMAFLGADVVKVEHRSRPDLMRVAGRQYGFGTTDLDSSLMFQEIGAGKRSVELDLRTAEDLDVARRLASVTDVVVENMRPGKMEQLGLSYDDIRAHNPGVVMCSQSGTGRISGPSLPGYAPIFWAEGGGAGLTGWCGRRPGIVRAPIDFHAATFALAGLLALLRLREATGRGGYIDCSAIEVVAAMFGVELAGLQLTDHQRNGNAFPGTLFNDLVPCAGEDEWVALTVADEPAWDRLCDALGFDSLRPKAAQLSPDELVDALAEATRSRLADELAAQLRSIGIPAVVSTSLARLFNDSRLWERGLWQNMQHNPRDTHPIVGLPWRADRTAYTVPRPSPRLGADTSDVVAQWLG